MTYVLRFFRSRLFRLVVVIGGFIAIITLTRSIFDFWQRRNIVKERQEMLAKVKSDNEVLKQKLSQSQTPEFVEREARDKLGLVKEGEVVILMDTPGVANSGQGAQEQGDTIPKWKQWWRLFF